MDPTQAALGVPSFTLEQLRSLVTELESGSTELARALEPVHGPWVSLTAAVVLIGKGQRPRALAAVRRALEQGVTSWFVHLVSARLSQSVGAVQGLSPRFERALELASELPHRLRVLDAWCDAAESLGQIREAVHAVEQSLVLAGSDVGRHLTAARLLRLGGSHARVMPHMRAVLWFQPSAQHYLTAAQMLRALGRWDEARAMAHEAMSTADAAERDQAVEELLRAGQRAPDSIEDAARETLLRLRIDDATTVEAGFDRLLLTYAGHPVVLARRAELYMTLGRYRDAARDFSEAVRADKTLVRAAVGRAALALCEGSARQCLQRLAGLDGGVMTSTLLAWRAEARRREGLLDEAVEDLEESGRLCASRASVWINLALAYGARGSPEALSEGFERVRRCAPGLLVDAATALGVELERAPEPISPEVARAVLEGCLTQMRGNRSSACGMYFNREGRLRSVEWRVDAPEDGMNREALKRARELLSWGARGAPEKAPP